MHDRCRNGGAGGRGPHAPSPPDFGNSPNPISNRWQIMPTNYYLLPRIVRPSAIPDVLMHCVPRAWKSSRITSRCQTPVFKSQVIRGNKNCNFFSHVTFMLWKTQNEGIWYFRIRVLNKNMWSGTWYCLILLFEIRILYKSVVCEFGVQYRKAFFLFPNRCINTRGFK